MVLLNEQLVMVFNDEDRASIPRAPTLLVFVFAGIIVIFPIQAHSITNAIASPSLHYDRANEIRRTVLAQLSRSGEVTPQIEGLLVEAIRELEKSIELYPEYAEAYELLIIFYEDFVLFNERDQSRRFEVREIIEQLAVQLARLEPLEPLWPMKLYLLKARAEPDREIMIKDIIDSFPDYAPAYRHYAEDLTVSGEIQKAIKVYQKYLRIVYEQGEVPHADAIRKLWDLLTEQQRKNEAVDLLDRFIDSDVSRPALVEVVKRLDISDYPEGQYPELFDKIQQIKRYEDFSNLEQAIRHLESGQLAEAMEKFDRHIELNPYGISAARPFAEALVKQGHYREAYRVYEALLDSNTPVANKCVKLKGMKIRLDYLEPTSQLPEKLVKTCSTWVTLVK